MELKEATVVLVGPIAEGEFLAPFGKVPSLDFLGHKHILPKSDNWESSEIAQTTPFNNSISFVNGVAIGSEIDRLNIRIDLERSQNLDEIVGVIVKIIDKLDGVKYTGAGINFTAAQKIEQPSDYLTENFLSKISQIPEKRLIGGSFTYVYSLDEVQSSITVSPVSKIAELGSPSNHLGVTSNYHYACTFPKKIQTFLRNIAVYREDFSKQANAMIVK